MDNNSFDALHNLKEAKILTKTRVTIEALDKISYLKINLSINNNCLLFKHIYAGIRTIKHCDNHIFIR